MLSRSSFSKTDSGNTMRIDSNAMAGIENVSPKNLSWLCFISFIGVWLWNGWAKLPVRPTYIFRNTTTKTSLLFDSLTQKQRFCVSRLEGRSVRSTERSEARKVATRT
jgi:hypothetical protein